MSKYCNLSSALEKVIGKKIADGFSSNETEVIRDAVLRLKAEDTRIAAWQAAIAQGTTQIERGEGIAWSAEELESVTEAAIAAMGSCATINPDVLP